MDKRKRGIALFITLMVIASIMSIIAVSFSYLEKVQKDAGATSAIIQGDLLYKNISTVLKKFFPRKQDNSEKLKLIYSMPLSLTEAKSGFNLNLMCKPLLTAVPINWLEKEFIWKKAEKTNLAKDVLTMVMEKYSIEEPNELERLIMEEITGESSQNQDYTPRIKQQKGIVSRQQFNRVITNYRLLYDDPKVLLVPWERYFSFTEVTPKTKIDGVYLTAEFISVAFEIPIEIVLDSWVEGESNLRSFLKDNSIIAPVNKDIYSKKALNAMHCEQTYAYQEGQYKFNFDYIEGRSANFEFNGKE
ncbi:hypothetical protein MNB_SV-14-839 [hydrothermal vent metagenome]|uniref:General secretion pathway protein K n=1 Tax=hydrothermal vent metagenome TaxID=652676 RepID=A0A1W1BG68_9ZZZZ